MTARPDRAGRGRLLTEVALTAGAVAGLLCLLAALAATIFGVTPLVFRSGSMQPAIGVGSVALARTVPADRIGEGDVVSVVDETGDRLTHRVVAVEAVAGNSATLRLKGDANEAEDVQRHTVTEADRVFFHAEKVGYMLTWLSGPVPVFAAGLFAGVLLMIAFRPHGRREGDQPPPPESEGAAATHRRAPATSVPELPEPSRRQGVSRHRMPPAVLLPATVLVLATLPAPQARAADADAAVATSAAFGSRAEFLPRADQRFGSGSFVTCAVRTVGLAPDLVDISWRHVGAPYRYRLILRDLDGRAWRSWDVTNVPAGAGETVTYTITGAGMPRRSEIWQYDLEVHTMLPAPPVSTGEVSTGWRGVGIYQDAGTVWQEDLNCSLRGQQDRPVVQVSAPASVNCVSQPPLGPIQARAVLSWPHLGAPHTYSVTVRDANSGNVTSLQSVTAVPAQAGQTVTVEIGTVNLNPLLRTGDAAVAEIRGVVSGVHSTRFVSQPITVGLTSVSCAGAPSIRSAPQSSTSATSSTPSPSASSPSVSSSTGASPTATTTAPPPAEAPSAAPTESPAPRTESTPEAPPPASGESPPAEPEPRSTTTTPALAPEQREAPPEASESTDPSAVPGSGE